MIKNSLLSCRDQDLSHWVGHGCLQAARGSCLPSGNKGATYTEALSCMVITCFRIHYPRDIICRYRNVPGMNAFVRECLQPGMAEAAYQSDTTPILSKPSKLKPDISSNQLLPVKFPCWKRQVGLLKRVDIGGRCGLSSRYKSQEGSNPI